LLGLGGLEAVKANNDAKAKLVYDAIEASNGFYSSPVEPSVRSNMNIPFTIPSSPDLEKAFISEAAKLGLVGYPTC
jgi:phosphoserine aminotransferase